MHKAPIGSVDEASAYFRVVLQEQFAEVAATRKKKKWTVVNETKIVANNAMQP